MRLPKNLHRAEWKGVVTDAIIASAVARPSTMRISDTHPLTAKVLNPGDGSCGLAHYEVISEGIGICRGCGRVKSYRSKA